MVISISNRQKLIKINPQKIKRLLRKALNLSLSLGLASQLGNVKELDKNTPIEVSVVFVNDRTIKRLNLIYRNTNKITDVLSFPQLPSIPCKHLSFNKKVPIFLGDIVINAHQAKRQALCSSSTFYGEITRLLIHGLLHLLGYDHEKNNYQKKKMFLAEAKLLSLLKVS
ncbi:MAG: rRNA maturation RNase YbeY [Thermodesulfovibrionales bacterium]|nr:rRNA maturation RNase YbeY [Thermodesulfovibrionales bacterium]